MFRIFPMPNTFTVTTNYSAHNGVLTVLSYDPSKKFNAHLLVGFDNNKKTKNISYSSCGEPTGNMGNAMMFSLNVINDSEVYITFYSGNIYYANCFKVSGELLTNLQKRMSDLYSHPDCQTGSQSKPEPEILLRNIAVSVKAHEDNVRADLTINGLLQCASPFIKSLTSKFAEELKRLNSNTQDTANTIYQQGMRPGT